MKNETRTPRPAALNVRTKLRAGRYGTASASYTASAGKGAGGVDHTAPSDASA